MILNKMEFEELAKELKKITTEIEQKLKTKGLNKNQIQIKMNTIKVDFLLYLFVNGKNFEEQTSEERMQFYTKYLEMELEEI